MQEATLIVSACRLRRLFAIILFNCGDVSDPRSLYQSYWAAMSEDFAHHHPDFTEQQLQDFLVRELDALLGMMYSHSIFEWVPSLHTCLLEHATAVDNSINHLLQLQLSSSSSEIQQQLDCFPLLNAQQHAIFDAVLASVNNSGTQSQQNVFFVDGPAG
ncbi:helicase [Fragilaria crotonensis]|nr:helicase [Fragilaria crotonensis]